MNSLWKQIGYAVFMGMVLPAILLSFAVLVLEEKEEPDIQVETIVVQQSVSVEEETQMQAVPMTMRLRQPDGSTIEMDMDTYLVSVVLAEMPAYFEPEALKAQSVVARTYTQKAYITGGKHGDGSVCTRSNCCQAYIPVEDYLGKGGTQENVNKVSKAVLETSGYVLTYEGNLIEATYFSCSGGTTEDAVAVWGTDFPYLQSVASPGEETAAHYTDTEEFTPEQFQAALGVSLSGEPSDWFGPVTYTDGGGVDIMRIGGQNYQGTQLRSLLGLRSTAFTVSVADGIILITTKGFGHRVGMSQYGAEAMAVEGKDYTQILAHYYQGTELTRMQKDA